MLGKSEKGKISISISQVSNRIYITVKDDGHGIDYEKIRAKALRVFPERINEIMNADETELLQYIFSSGFSTKDEVTEYAQGLCSVRLSCARSLPFGCLRSRLSTFLRAQ